MTVDELNARLVRWADDLETAATPGAKAPDTAARARAAIENGVTLYDSIVASDPIAFDNPLDVLEAAGWLTDVRALICDGVSTMIKPWSVATRVASGGITRVRKHIVRSGDTLQSIAATLLGDWREWARIADANSLDPAAPLTVGGELIIPEPDRKSA